jgi:protein O-mannosyl-transferase
MNKKYTYPVVIFLIVACLAAFGRIAGNDFINYDDEGYITENNNIKSGIKLESVKWAFTANVVSNWVPLALISHMLDWILFGSSASGHHLVSLLLHIGAVIFLFLFLSKTTNNIWPSAFAAALFALHPLRVESVAWAAERKDVLSMFFGMASLYAYAFYAESFRLSRYFLCLILFVLSLLSKSMLVTLPFVFLLLDYWPLGRWQKALTAPLENRSRMMGRIIWEKAPFIFLTILSSIITISVQSGTAAHTPFPTRIPNAIVAYVLYLKKTFWPFDLALFYFSVDSFPLWQIIACCFILSGITIVVIYFFKKKPFLFTGWFWYLGTMIPVIGLVPTNALIADHYTYLPSIGLAIMLSWGVQSLIKSKETGRKIIFPAAIVILAILAVLTWQQCGYWKNSVKLWSHALKVTKNNSHAYLRLGNAYIKQGQYDKAIENYRKLIQLNPTNFVAYNRLGIAYSYSGRFQLAIENFNNAIQLKPDCAEAYNNRAIIHLNQRKIVYGCDDARKACSMGVCVTLEAAQLKGYCR